MRGEDAASVAKWWQRFRITPACAGKTRPQLPNGGSGSGSPPHARGRRGVHMSDVVRNRITPACAGKTWIPLHADYFIRDHPRMRGEDFPAEAEQVAREGSPPHARGRLRRGAPIDPSLGITPACAGKTIERRTSHACCTDHPRMRGEDHRATVHQTNVHGSPPHARGRRSREAFWRYFGGITPACAGKTRQT